MVRSTVIRLFGLALGVTLIAGCGGTDAPKQAGTSDNSVSGAPSSTPLPPAPGALPRIAVLATGGTIAGKSTPGSGVGYTAGQASAQDLIDAVPGIDKIATLQPEQVANVGSQDMTEEIWLTLARRINQVFADNAADGVVVTHGTDTIEETAFFLDNVVGGDKPVVLAGAMRPATALSPDGPANLRAAVTVAAAPQARGRGAMVVLNDTIHGARDVTKTHTTSVQTFVSPNSGPEGYVDTGSVRFVKSPLPHQRPRFRLPDAAPLPRVDIVYSHAGMRADQVHDAVGHGAKGIVLAGVGDGNTAKSVIDALAAANDDRVVVRSTRVGAGEVMRNAEINDDELGFVTSADLNPPKSRVLLQLLLANDITDPTRVQQEFATR
ncbi:asparaginase [Nocardia mexicana]|uniref:asparaginase n=1 Tax=Nocardia mexicana TaxID=279262 RepID=A0A370HC46_9NOCA|nr:asparaginase [Nocardia mexicana]RDI54502.1 asparaginase [Nocardia mexicana]